MAEVKGDGIRVERTGKGIRVEIKGTCIRVEMEGGGSTGRNEGRRVHG